MTDREDLTSQVGRPALSDSDARQVSVLLEAAGVAHADLEPILTEPDADALTDKFLRDEVHAPHA